MRCQLSLAHEWVGADSEALMKVQHDETETKFEAVLFDEVRERVLMDIAEQEYRWGDYVQE